MMDQWITHELLFARCENWDALACPHRINPAMGLSIINQAHLFLLSDETVSQLKKICGSCQAFKKKNG